MEKYGFEKEWKEAVLIRKGKASTALVMDGEEVEICCPEIARGNVDGKGTPCLVSGGGSPGGGKYSVMAFSLDHPNRENKDWICIKPYIFEEAVKYFLANNCMEEMVNGYIILMKRALTIYAAALIMAVLAFKHVLMLGSVPTGSMEGTIAPGDNVICTRFGIGEDGIRRYDILVFTPPDKLEMIYIKRVIGMSGETIEVRNGKVYADGQELDNSFTNGPQNRKGDGIYKVPEGCYFFLGDNRNNSNDSRFWKQKYVPAANIQAKARCIIYPLADAGWL